MLLRICIYQPNQLTTKMLRFIITSTLAILPFFCFSIDSKGENSNTLFSSSEPLELVLELDLQKVLRDKSDDPEYSPAILIHNLNEEDIQVFNIKIKARGNTRRIGDICEFPPLKINFEKKSTENTVFQGQDKIKMVTHCNSSEDYQNYALLEYLAYKTYNTLTDYSYRVRMVNVTYRDISQNYPDIEKSGFMIEDDELMAKRVQGKVSDKRIWSPDSCDENSVDVFSIFQFMIGNTDWWIHTRHNVDLISLNDEKLIPIPYDFDGAGIINTPYAMPSTQLPIINVRDRFFKSSCKTLDYHDYQKTIELFNSKKADIISMLNEATFLEKKYRKSSLRYIDDFYEIINDSGKFSKFISQNCKYVNTVPDRAPNQKRSRN